MPASIDGQEACLETTRARLHQGCVVCGSLHPSGLHAEFHVTGEHTVEAEFPCGKIYEGYQGVLHGGIVSALLDGAMANCLLAKGLEAYTVDLRIRFRGPVVVDGPAQVKGEWLRCEGPLHLLQASISQEGRLKAQARAKFMEGSPTAPAQALPVGIPSRDLLNQCRKRL